MVFFICDHCQETIKKAKVPSHRSVCPGTMSLSCVDCGVHFTEATFASHTSCISEAEKYQGATYQPKTTKGNPQEEWIDQLSQTLAITTDRSLRSVLERLLQYPNVPRKEKQFLNFVSNSCHLESSLVSRVWNLLEETKRRLSEEKQAQRQQEMEARKRAREAREEEEAKASPKKAKSAFSAAKCLRKRLAAKGPQPKEKLLKHLQKKAPAEQREAVLAEFDRLTALDSSEFRVQTVVSLPE